MLAELRKEIQKKKEIGEVNFLSGRSKEKIKLQKKAERNVKDRYK